MARDEFRVELTADNQISKEAKKAAQDLDKIPEKVEVELTADSKLVARNIDDVLTKVDKLSGDAANLLLTSNADAIAREIADLVLDVDRLDAADPSIDVKAGQIDKLQGDLDALATKAKEINDTPITLDTSGSVDSVKNIGVEADGAQNAMANMVGNSAQDLGELAGVGGTAGVALGQLAEYAADGNIALANLAKTAGPMAAMAFVTKGLADHFAEIAETKAFNADQVREFADALSEGATSAEALAAALDETGKLEFRFEALDQTVDLVPVLRELGLTVTDFDRIMRSGTSGIAAWGEAAREAGADADTVALVMDGATKIGDNYATGQKTMAAVTAVLGDEFADTAGKVEDGSKAMELASGITDAAAEAMGAYAAEAQSAADALNAQADALNAQVDAALAAADQQLAVNDAFAEFGEILGDDEASANDVRDSAIDLAKATSDLKTEQAKANGVALTGTQRLDNQNDALLETARTATGPARQGILDYIGSVNQIPPEKMTEIQAAIDRGDLDEAKRLLNEASAPRKAAVNADANTAQAERDLNWLARPREAMVAVRLQGATGGFGGAVVTAGTTSAPTAGLMAAPVARTAPAQTIHINLNAAVIGDRYEVQRAVTRAIRGATRIGGARLARAEVAS